MKEVIYITGPPAAGKTTLVENLHAAFPDLEIFIYSKLLSEHIGKRDRTKFSQKRLREQSGTVVTPEDIEQVDHYLIKSVQRVRKFHHVLIDSHPVTKEGFGFRVTAFSVPLLKALRPTRICMLFTDAQTVIKRIQAHPKGRPKISKFEADFHCFSQASVAITYGIQLGVPVYFYNSSKGTEEAFYEIAKKLK
jgi:adenylate kinase